MAFLGAGILFTDEKHVLAGYSYRKQITGFGGHRRGEETPAQTAFREVVEELFEVEVGEELVDKLDQRTFQTGILCPFESVVLCLGAENIQNRHPERCRF